MNQTFSKIARHDATRAPNVLKPFVSIVSRCPRTPPEFVVRFSGQIFRTGLRTARVVGAHRAMTLADAARACVPTPADASSDDFASAAFDRLRALRDELVLGRGVYLFRGLPVQRWDRWETCAAFYALHPEQFWGDEPCRGLVDRIAAAGGGGGGAGARRGRPGRARAPPRARGRRADVRVRVRARAARVRGARRARRRRRPEVVERATERARGGDVRRRIQSQRSRRRDR